jgi:hypothetical protein
MLGSLFLSTLNRSQDHPDIHQTKPTGTVMRCKQSCVIFAALFTFPTLAPCPVRLSPARRRRPGPRAPTRKRASCSPRALSRRFAPRGRSSAIVLGAPPRWLPPRYRAPRTATTCQALTADTITVQNTPSVLYVGHGGLLDVAVDPESEDNRLIYLSYLQGTETASTIGVLRARFDQDTDALTLIEVIFEGSPGNALPGRAAAERTAARRRPPLKERDSGLAGKPDRIMLAQANEFDRKDPGAEALALA